MLAAVREVGYESPSPIQRAAIPPLLAGKDLLGQAQTGTGKTAAFALPLLSRLDLKLAEPQLLVLTPTRELAIQVAEAMQTYARHLKGFHVLPVYGGQGMDFQFKQLRRGVHAVVGTPGRIQDHLRRKTLKLGRLKTVVLDEADEMLRMGFIEDVEDILKHMPEEKQVALFSATMPDRIRKIVQHHLSDPVEIKIKAKTATVASVDQRYVEVRGFDKLEALTRILEVEEFDAMLIFVRTRSATTELAEKLEARGLASAALSGEMTQALRERTIERIKSGKLDIVVATDVAARGLDVERVTHVVNYDVPNDVEGYIHRIGRTGQSRPCGPCDLVRDAARAQHARGDRACDAPADHADASADARGRRAPTRGAVQAAHHRGDRGAGSRVLRAARRGLRAGARQGAARDRRGARVSRAEGSAVAAAGRGRAAAFAPRRRERGPRAIRAPRAPGARRARRARRRESSSMRHPKAGAGRARERSVAARPPAAACAIESRSATSTACSRATSSARSRTRRGSTPCTSAASRSSTSIRPSSLPEGMPTEIYEQLQKTWVCGQKLAIRVDSAGDEPAGGVAASGAAHVGARASRTRRRSTGKAHAPAGLAINRRAPRSVDPNEEAMNQETITIDADKVVTFHYTLRGEDGTQIESSAGKDPVTYMHGHANIVPGLEQEMTRPAERRQVFRDRGARARVRPA